MLSLVSAVFGSPVEANSALPVVKDRIGAEALDLLASEIVAQAFQRPKVSSQGHPVGSPRLLLRHRCAHPGHARPLSPFASQPS